MHGQFYGKCTVKPTVVNRTSHEMHGRVDGPIKCQVNFSNNQIKLPSELITSYNCQLQIWILKSLQAKN